MHSIASIAAMQQFQFGQSIHCSDGEEGLLAQVVFDSATHRLIALGIRLGHWFGRRVYAPFEAVVTVTADDITLRISCADLTTSPQEGSAGALLDSKSVVQTTPASGNPTRSTLRLLAVHPGNGELAYLVARHLRSQQDTLFYEKDVAQIETGRLNVSLSEAAWQSLPQYHPDSALQQEVEERLHDLMLLHIDSRGMQVRVIDSILYLTGNISSSLSVALVQNQVMGVEGLSKIENELIGDDTLANDLAMASAHDPRTHALPIGIYPHLGNVRLRGSVQKEQQKADAEEIVRHFPGVRSVANTLLVNPEEVMLHALSSAEEGQGKDRIPGKYTRHTR